MRRLPSVCAQDGLLVPEISDATAAWLQSTDADALDTLTALGCPAEIGAEYRGLERLHVTNAVSDFRTGTGDRVGEACMVLVNIG